jgi:glycosyltransferase involved in cell wall biosynthesis
MSLDKSGGIPLVSVVVVCYEGNVHLLNRAILSLRAQDIGDENFHVIVYYDGCAWDDQAEMDMVEAACHGLNFPCTIIGGNERIGFHTVPRNMMMPHCMGQYVVNMDADNEFAPNHLSGLLAAIRTRDPESGRVPEFVYSRREYVRDSGCDNPKAWVGETPLIPWNIGRCALAKGPKYNFIDTGDMMISKGAMYEIPERMSGGKPGAPAFIWNPVIRRYPDFDLAKRMAQCGFVGVAVDQVSNIYHWTGKNIQLTDGAKKDIVVMPLENYRKLHDSFLVKDN